MATKTKPKCRYWEKCFRKEAAHKKQFRHPADDVSDSEDDTDKKPAKAAANSDDSGSKMSLNKKSVVFTGTLLGCTRTQAEVKAKTYGCYISSTVTKTLDYVVVGEEAGSKADKAKALGLKIVTQSEWEKMLKNAAPKPPGRATRQQSVNYDDNSSQEVEPDTPKGKKKPKLVKFSSTASVIGGMGKKGASITDPQEMTKKRTNDDQTKKPRLTHAVSQSGSDTSETEDESDKPSPVKKAKTSADGDDDAAKPSTSKAPEKKRRVKCQFWKKCFRKNKAHKQEYCHPGDSDEEDAVDQMEEDEVDPSSLPPAKNPMKDGESVKIVGKHQDYTIKRTGDTYYCTCYQWKMMTRATNKRSCKHLKGHLGDKFENLRCGDEIIPGSEVINRGPRHKSIPQVLLANKWDPSKQDPTGWWMSEKLDGVRAYWDGKSFYSRLGNEFIPPSWFIKNFPSDFTLDGELFGGRAKFQSTVSIVKTPGSGKWKDLKYYIFDAPSLEKQPFEQRVANIKDYFDKNKATYAYPLEHQKCKGVDHLKAEQKKVEGKFGEGLMIREPKSLYEHRRSNTLLKIKTFHDAEALVIGHEKGKGRNQFVCGAICCQMANGKKFKCGSGLTDKDRRNPPKKGSIITYRFQEYTLDGIPRFPSYVGIRIDADGPSDCILPKKDD